MEGTGLPASLRPMVGKVGDGETESRLFFIVRISFCPSAFCILLEIKKNWFLFSLVSKFDLMVAVFVYMLSQRFSFRLLL